MKLRTAISTGLLLALIPVVVYGSNTWGPHWASGSRSPTSQDKADPDLYDIPAVIAEWNIGGTGISPQYGGGKNIEIRSRNAGIFWYGLAEVFVEDGHITRAKVTLNDRLLSSKSAAFRDLVACQEVGHVIGLQHQVAPDTCMNNTLNPDNIIDPTDPATSPNAHDATELTSIYTHNDAPPPEEEPGGGGPPCSKHPDKPNCDPNKQGVWIVVDVFWVEGH